MTTRTPTFAFALALPSIALAGGKWTYGGRAGVSQKGNTVVPTLALSAEYAVNRYATWRTDLEASFRSVAEMDKVALSIPTQLLLHPMGNGAVFDPYLGPGLSASMDFEQQITAGAHAVAGFSIHPRKGQAFGLEGRWGWPDMFDGGESSWSMALTGNWNVKFGNRN